MRATDFEFRYRFFVFGLIFWAGFTCYVFDQRNTGEALLRLISGPGLDLDSAQGRHGLQVIFGLATLLMAGAAMMRTWSTAYLKTDVVHDMDLRSEAMMADGPYRHTRNPLYFSNLLMTAAMAMLASLVGAVVMALAMLLFQFRLIFREEQRLLQTQGDRYVAYLKAVPRLWPWLRPRVPSSGLKPQWAQAWLGEAMFWGFVLAVAVFAVTLKLKYAYIFVGLSILFYLVVVPLWQRRKHVGNRSHSE